MSINIDISYRVDNYGRMELQHALIMFDALSQETRLKAFRLLVEAGPKGLAAGDISKTLSTPHNTMSFHLTHLVNAGIVNSHKKGRSMIYSVNFNQTQALMTFMAENCCIKDPATAATEAGCESIKNNLCCDES